MSFIFQKLEKKNLVFASLLSKKGFEIVLESDKVIVTKSGMFIKNGYSCDDMFKFSINKINVISTYMVESTSFLKTTISTFFLYFVTPPNKNHRLYLWLINSFPPHITHVFDSRSFLLSSYHASPISKLPTIPNSFIINI